ncbi:acyltransferase family protein [Bombiscardovia apis]|uniref:acyltransferase family protein n=1 Tax=Bombiscardovia apis TaxID=2932182 RepID=UPI002953B23B|nr:acyltransferase family protein [Bombiscardovia apis]
MANASVAQTKSYSKRRMRNSNFEVLRIVSMFLITLFHFPWDNVNIAVGSDPLSSTIISNTAAFLTNWGSFGNTLFFILSSWFLCEEQQSLKKNLHRVWLMELQLIFYAWCIVAFDYFILHIPYHGTEWIHVLFPFATGGWWYVTGYGLFLFVAPFLTLGLRKIGPKNHLLLASSLLLIYGFTPSRTFIIDMPACALVFVYLYTIMSYIRWYIPELLESRKAAIILIIFGVVFGFVYQGLLSKIISVDWWLFHTRNATSLAISLGLIILAINRPETHSRIVNKLASATLGVFLIQVSSLGKRYSVFTSSSALGNAIGARLLLLDLLLAVVFFVVCIAFDLLRQVIFTFTVDKVEAKPFTWLYQNIRKLFYTTSHKIILLNKTIESEK